MPFTSRDDRSLASAVLGDGRPLLLFSGVCLLLSGGFALFQAATGHFLPHDVAFLGMQPDELCAINECRIVHFMIHDRISFGGSLLAVSALYLWLTEFPLRARQAWSWWVLTVSGLLGFGSFLAYLGYGYLDTWHGIATLCLLPCFVMGLARSYPTLTEPRGAGSLLTTHLPLGTITAYNLGRMCLLGTSIGLVSAGLTIMTVGVTTVFVPTDLEFMGLSRAEVAAVNPHLIPLIAHDRAGFGGGVATTGITLLLCIWCAVPSRSLWQVLALAGIAGFGTAIFVHPVIGYTDTFHLAPAVLGAVVYALGLALTFRTACGAASEVCQPATA